MEIGGTERYYCPLVAGVSVPDHFRVNADLLCIYLVAAQCPGVAGLHVRVREPAGSHPSGEPVCPGGPDFADPGCRPGHCWVGGGNQYLPEDKNGNACRG